MKLALRFLIVIALTVLPTSAVAVDGPLAMMCEWPSSLWGVCSTALIHPRVAVASGHCHGGGVSRTMEFGENNTTPALTMHAMCYTVPGVDLSYCLLDEAVDVPFVPPAMGCELMGLGDGAAHPGYGQADYGGMYYSEGTKRVSDVHIDSVSSTSFSATGPASRANDSGSPVYVPAPDGTWRTLGVVLDSDFVSRSSGVILAPSIAYIETQTGIDVTPCHTAAGVWDPGPECRNFPRTSQRGAGSWPSCYFDLDPAYSDSCGAPYASTPLDGGVDAGVDGGDDAGNDAGAMSMDASTTSDAALSDLAVPNDDAGSDSGSAMNDAGAPLADGGVVLPRPMSSLTSACSCELATTTRNTPGGFALLCLLASVATWRARRRT